jgi:ketosteroid isomerase-like protein
MIGSLLSEDVNVIEIYIIRGGKKEYGYDAGWSKPPFKLVQHLQDTYGSGTKQKLQEYIHSDMVYVFDRSDDRQRVYRKIAMKECDQSPFYGVGYNEETLPVHHFPCVSTITMQREIQRTVYRINNRIHIYVDVIDGQTSYTIRYQHAANVDMRKIEADVERMMNGFRRCVG